MAGIIRLAIAFLALLVVGPALAQGQGVAPNLPVLISADQVHYDRDRGIVTASGNVEISQGARILLADRVVYNRNTKVMSASGHVSLAEPTGEVFFADRVELSEDLKNGVITNFRMLFPDESRFAATEARRTDGTRTEMDRAVFSPCKLCEEDPTRAPLWQIKARKVIHDQETHDIEYRDATLEMFGLPVAYTPYLTHPDPTVKRRTGLLTPTVGSDTQLGQIVRTPVFIVLGPDKDMTLEPIFTTKERAALAAEYRQRFVGGKLETSGSFTRVERRGSSGDETKGEQNRGHIFGNGRFDIDDTWRWGFDAGWTTDDTFLRRYNFTSTPVLTSTAFVEGFRGRNYASVRGYHFQGLRVADDYNKTPIVAPLIDYNLIGEPNSRWGRWSLDQNVMGLWRVEGTDSRRLSVKAGWRLPYTAPSGHITTVSVSLQGDVYSVNAVRDPADPTVPKFSGVTGRLFPQMMVDWRYPFVRELGNVRHLIEPRIAFVAGPNAGNPSRIPNEDSQDLEFDDSNLFSANRFPGLDRVDVGQRIVYGLGTTFYGDRGGLTTIFVGQSFKFREDDTFLPGTGLENNLSDIVGRVKIRPSDYFSLIYRFRLDRDGFKSRRSELRSRIGPKSINLNVNYLFFNGLEDPSAEFRDREEITLRLTSQLTRYWSVSARTRHDLTENGGVLQRGVAVNYEDECFGLTADFSRNFTRDRDFRASNRFFLRLVFKHLGQVQTGG